jgi:hypothetical protein
MGGWGRQNPWPIQWGGGESSFEQLWQALRKALGTRGPGPIGGIEDAWRESKVVGLLTATTAMERAATQALPDRATDHLEVYENLLGLPPEGPAQQRRSAAASAWTSKIDATIPALRSALQAIDAGLDIVTVIQGSAAIWQMGRSYADRTSGVGGTRNTQFPNFSQHFIVHVIWLGLPMGLPDPAKRLRVEALLNTALPSWVDWTIFNGAGFFLDGFNSSYLDLTAFSP